MLLVPPPTCVCLNDAAARRVTMHDALWIKGHKRYTDKLTIWVPEGKTKKRPHSNSKRCVYAHKNNTQAYFSAGSGSCPKYQFCQITSAQWYLAMSVTLSCSHFHLPLSLSPHTPAYDEIHHLPNETRCREWWAASQWEAWRISECEFPTWK